jgi:hypothetical protein
MTTPDNVASDPEALRERAEHYRELTSRTTDPMAIEALLELADHYDALAAELEARAWYALLRPAPPLREKPLPAVRADPWRSAH